MLRIKSHRNAENFIKIGDHFCTSGARALHCALPMACVGLETVMEPRRCMRAFP